MTHYEMCKAALLRPDDYSQLSKHRQWDIDKGLGILDWEGVHLSRASEFLESDADNEECRRKFKMTRSELSEIVRGFKSKFEDSLA